MVIPLPHYFISDHDWAGAQKCLSCVVFFCYYIAL